MNRVIDRLGVMKKNTSIAIIGGGIIGCTIAYELSGSGYTNITVLERNTTIPGLNQSSTNEGSIHSGVYYPKSIMPLKAQLCVEGNDLMYQFLKKYKLPFKKVGKLIVATNRQEEEYLDFFLQVGIENKVPGIKKISGKEAMRMEPNLKNIIAALYLPSTGCASPNALIKKIKSLALANGVTFRLNTNVTAINSRENRFVTDVRIGTSADNFLSEVIINAAGLYSDEIAKMINPEFPFEIDAARGEFFQFDKTLRKNIWMNGMHVYQPPYCYVTKNGNFKKIHIPVHTLQNRLKKGDVIITAGVHLSPAYDERNGAYVLDNTITISPLKTTGLGKENYSSHLKIAEDYIGKVHYFFPNLRPEDLKPHHTGIMCPLKGYRDFVIEKDRKYPNCIHLVGMESPAWTSTFAVAKYVSHVLSL